MRKNAVSQSALIATASEKFRDYFLELLPRCGYAPINCVASASEAKRALLSLTSDLTVIGAPLPDEAGTQLALDLAERRETGVLLLVRAESYDQIVSQTRGTGVFVLSRPTNRTLVEQALNLLSAARSNMIYYQQKASSLETRMEEIRLVNRAKLILITRLNMSEPEAHRYIEKTAMDRGLRKREVAETILRTYDN